MIRNVQRTLHLISQSTSAFFDHLIIFLSLSLSIPPTGTLFCCVRVQQHSDRTLNNKISLRSVRSYFYRLCLYECLSGPFLLSFYLDHFLFSRTTSIEFSLLLSTGNNLLTPKPLRTCNTAKLSTTQPPLNYLLDGPRNAFTSLTQILLHDKY